MSFADRTRVVNMDEPALIEFHKSYGVFIRSEFRLPGNAPLMASCRRLAGERDLSDVQASFVILKALQHHLASTRVLRIVKS